MRTQWTAKGNRDAGSSCLCDRGLHRYHQNFGGGGLNTPNPPSRYATVSKGSASAVLQHLPWCSFVTLHMQARHPSESIVSQPKVNFMSQILKTNGTFCASVRLVLNWLQTLVILNCGSNCSCTDSVLTNVQYSQTHIMKQQPIEAEVPKLWIT